ncbi:MAG TPA: nucleoside triphosphate pyrophosphatase [Caulobacteraceae bacterium]
MRPVILASASATRAKVLAAAGVAFRISPSKVDEAPIKRRLLAAGADPRTIASRLAEAKAREVAGREPGLVIGADQTLELEGELFDKTRSLDETRDVLRRLRGRRFDLHAAVALADGSDLLWQGGDTARLTMRDFSDAFLEGYLARNAQALGSSLGGFELEAEGAQLFESMEGDFFAVLGLPLMPLLAQLRLAGSIAA